jgi:anti-sigma factor RsiW
MNTPRPDFTDTDLSAWLDGAFDEATRRRIEAWLREDPEAAARMRLFAADRDALRARFAGVVDEPVPERLADVARGSARGWEGNRWAQAAAAAGLLVLGGAIGAWSPHRPAPRPAGCTARPMRTACSRPNHGIRWRCARRKSISHAG